ncbi:MAG: HlyD family efflux transporter periplasmic adaptor subunit [Candidatus Zixiibacteriota bacterium]
MRSANYLVILMAGLLFFACNNRDLSPGGSGFIEATEVVVSSEIGGQLKAIRFDEGEEIVQGDTIGEIDTVTTALRLHQAQAARQMAQTKVKVSNIAIEQAAYNLDLAKKEFDRAASLLKSGSVTQQQYDKVETAYHQAILSRKEADAAYQAALAELAQAESEMSLLAEQLNHCFPKSPESGTVTNKFVEVGELVGTGTPLVKIARLDTVWVKVYLPPPDLTKIGLGGHAQIDPENGQKPPLDGRVSWISSEAEFTPKNVQTKEARADLVYAVKITIPNPGRILKVGMPVSVKIQ